MSSTRAPHEGAYIPALDGIRAIAIAAVFALHLDRAHFPGGGFGVNVFFVLSAYLITSILLRELESTGGVEYGPFYWRRVFRLAPALLVWLVLIAMPTAILEHAASGIPWSTAGAIFYFNDFLQVFTHHLGDAYDQSWSLAVEEQFYLVWPVFLVLVARKLGARAQRCAIAGLVVASILIAFLAGNYFLPTGHLDALSLGCGAAFYAVRVDDSGAPSPLQNMPLAVGCLAIFVTATFINPLGSRGDALALLVDIAAMTLTLHCTFAGRSLVSRLLASAAPRWIGVRSYGIYLYGLTVMQLIPIVTHLRLKYAAPLDVFATAVLVAISYRYIEAPVRLRGRRWLSRRSERQKLVSEQERIGLAYETP